MPTVSQEEYEKLQAVKKREAARAVRRNAQKQVLAKHADEVRALIGK